MVWFFGSWAVRVSLIHSASQLVNQFVGIFSFKHTLYPLSLSLSAWLLFYNIEYEVWPFGRRCRLLLLLLLVVV